MRLIAYARVSTDDQAEHGHSLGQQVDRLRDHAAQCGHSVVDVVLDEGVSGSMPLLRRPGGKRVVEALKANRADGVLVVRLDRLFRDTFDGLRYFDERRDAQVVSVTEQIDTSTPQGRFFLTQLLAMAQYERDMAAQRARDCNTALRQQGRAYGGTPYGCVSINGELFREPHLWAQRCAIVQLRAEGISLRGLVDRLILDRVPSPAGARRWSTSTLSNVLSTHDGLAHLPLVTQPATPAAVLPETGASHGHVH